MVNNVGIFFIFNDREALFALEYVRDKIEKDRGLILLPDQTIKPQNDLGEAMSNMIETCRFEGRIIMTGKPQIFGCNFSSPQVNKY